MWQRHWLNISEDVKSADVLIFMSLKTERACSGLIEAGIAVHRKIPILIVSPDWWSFSNLPQCRTFDSLEPAIECLIAMARGEEARQQYDVIGLNGKKPALASV
jgi:hypothetical protein